jgi:hypothetical protein
VTGPEIADQFVMSNLVLSVKALYAGSIPLVLFLGWTAKNVYAATMQIKALEANNIKIQAHLDDLYEKHENLRGEAFKYVSRQSQDLQSIKNSLEKLLK